MSLRSLQQQFVHSVLTGNSDALATQLDTSQISAAGLMDIYRHNSHAALSKALELTYPVIAKLVGERFFFHSCDHYIQQHAPVTGNLDDYGDAFPAFLSNFPPAKTLPYLPDVARLEWAFHQSAIAPYAPRLEMEAFERVPQQRYEDLLFSLHPSVKFIFSPFPVDKIWEMNQEGADPDSTLDLAAEAGSELLLVRPDVQVAIYPLTRAEQAFLHEIQQSGGFFAAFEAALKIDESFDLAFYTKKHMVSGAISGFSLTPPRG